MTDTTTATPAIRSFPELGVDQRIADTLARDGITTPFAIQELTLPLALSGADVIGQARTGTGKTLAFGIPLLQRLDPKAAHVQALVIVPTRELCLQVHDDLALAGADLGVKTVAVYGGKAIEDQSAALEAGAQVVVGTPGRLLDLMRRGILRLGGVRGLVLDEADEMLDMGFLPDVEQLIEACDDDRQTLLFSATMPSEVVGLARRYMHKPTFMRADVEEPRIGPETAQHFLSCHGMDKPAVLARILQAPGRGLCVVFTRTKRMADTLVRELEERGVEASAIHSDLRQEARERTLRRFREGKVDVLCATEVAARGLDISDVTHVINYDCPDDEKMYLHRIGRTGRAGAAGVAVTLAVWNELARLEMIKKALEIDVPTHEVFSTSPLLDEIFELPPREVGKRASGRSTGGQRGSGKREGGQGGGDKRGGAGRGDDQSRGRGGKRGGDRRGGREDEGGRNDEGAQRRDSGERRVKRTHRVGQRAEGEAAEATPSSERDGGGATDAPADAPAEPRKRVRRRVEAPTISAAERDADGEPITAPSQAAASEEATDGGASQEQTGIADAPTDAEETSPRRASNVRGKSDATQRQRVRQRTRQRDRSGDVGDDDRARGGDGNGGASGDEPAERGKAQPGGQEPGDDAGSGHAERAGDEGSGGASRSDRSSGRSSSRGGRGRGGGRGGRGGRGRGGGGDSSDRGADGRGEARTESRSGGKGGQQRGGTGGRSGDRRGGRSSDQRGGRDGDQRGGRGRSGRSGDREQATTASNGGASASAGGTPTSEEARGEGKPALNRPLRIAHLP